MRSRRASLLSCFNISRRSRALALRSSRASRTAAILSRRFCFASSLFSSLFCFFSARMRASSIFFCSRASFLLSCFSVSFLAGLTFFFSLLTGDAPFSFLVCLTGAEGLSLFLTVFFTVFFSGVLLFTLSVFWDLTPLFLRVRASAFSVPLEISFLLIIPLLNCEYVFTYRGNRLS